MFLCCDGKERVRVRMVKTRVHEGRVEEVCQCSPCVEVQNPGTHTQMYKIQEERITENEPPTVPVLTKKK